MITCFKPDYHKVLLNVLGVVGVCCGSVGAGVVGTALGGVLTRLAMVARLAGVA